MDTEQTHRELDRILESLQSPGEKPQTDSLLSLGLDQETIMELTEKSACADCQAATWQLWEDQERITKKLGPTPVAYCKTMLQHTHVPGKMIISMCGEQQKTGR